MTKFTSIEQINDFKEVKPSLNKLIEKLISLNLSVSGDMKNINKKYEITGISQFVEKFNSIIEKHKKIEERILLEKLKYSNMINDQKEINNLIETLNESKHKDIIYSPEDIFETSDYEKINNNTFILKSLNNIPTYFMGKINNREANDFFSKGNNISIRYNGINEGWSLSFVDKYNYGTSIDDNNTKYKYFINENSEFVGDFIDAVKTLIGAENLKLEKKLLK